MLATEKKNKSILFEDHSTYKIEQVLERIIYISYSLHSFHIQTYFLQITGNIGMVYSGMGPDYRLLIRRARKMAQVWGKFWDVLGIFWGYFGDILGYFGDILGYFGDIDKLNKG